MTDQQFRAKTWLRRYRDQWNQLDNDRALLLVRANVVNKCTGSYETDGSGCRDIDAQNGKYQDALADYSEAIRQVEKDEKKLLEIFNEISAAIKQLYDPLLQKIATDIYLRNMKWAAVQSEEHISKSTLDRKHRDMLTELAKIVKI